MSLEISVHSTGGSGPYGASSYADRATGCLEFRRLRMAESRPCPEEYPESKRGEPNAMLLGTMVHGMIEAELKGASTEEVLEATFVDHECDWEIPEAWVTEARRIYEGWLEVREGWPPYGIHGVELGLTAELAPGVIGNAKIDLLWEDENGELVLEDFKTAGRSGDTYTRGRTRLQLHFYCMIAWANGYPVSKIRVRQIVKTKKVQENIYEDFDLPTPSRERFILRYLQGALAREAAGPTGPLGAGCDGCRFAKSGECKL